MNSGGVICCRPGPVSFFGVAKIEMLHLLVLFSIKCQNIFEYFFFTGLSTICRRQDEDVEVSVVSMMQQKIDDPYFLAHAPKAFVSPGFMSRMESK